ncbi:response regulator [Catenuloplanes japonicus]|uniref:response regulator n=1 Tax=Catenuloplanes japonicus TaxID=33876 RepID=UPI0007C48B0E|nr:response regulator [Catenuloplanes japonicus]
MTLLQDEQPQPTVLVVDDEVDLRDIMRRMLERRGFTALTAGDARAAIDLCRDHDGPVDLLVTDLSMPEATGREVAEQALALRPGLRVIYVSGLPKEVAVDKGMVGEDARLLQKPFTTSALIDAVKDALQHDAPSSPPPSTSPSGAPSGSTPPGAASPDSPALAGSPPGGSPPGDSLPGGALPGGALPGGAPAQDAAGTDQTRIAGDGTP